MILDQPRKKFPQSPEPGPCRHTAHPCQVTLTPSSSHCLPRVEPGVYLAGGSDSQTLPVQELPQQPRRPKQLCLPGPRGGHRLTDPGSEAF
jgi:hypothetical protein